MVNERYVAEPVEDPEIIACGFPWKVLDTCSPYPSLFGVFESEDRARLIASWGNRVSEQDAEKWRRENAGRVQPKTVFGIVGRTLGRRLPRVQCDEPLVIDHEASYAAGRTVYRKREP